MADASFGPLTAVSMAAFFAVAPVSASEQQGGGAPMDTTEKRDAAVQAVPDLPTWPCRLIVSEDLLPFVRRAWDLSATFRDQCRKLAEARAVIVLHSTSEGSPEWRARTSISRSLAGVVVAHVHVRPVGRAVELIAHELEHVLERVEGVNYLLQTRRGGSVLLPEGTFETRRAVEAGRRVAREVEEAARARGRAGQ